MKNTALLLACALPLGIYAQNDKQLHDFERDTIVLSQVVVTGTRTPKMLADAPVATRVITSKDIERTDATDIQDLLTQELPGVEFSYAMNQQTHLNFSGFGGQSILFLVDGERLAGETMDDVDFSRLLMAGVERIEIVKGAASQKKKDRMLLISLPAEFTTVCFTNLVFFYPFAKNNRTMR